MTNAKFLKSLRKLCLFPVVPFLVSLLGFGLNQLADWSNGGRMPVLFPRGVACVIPDGDVIHQCMTSASHLKILCDIFISDGGISSLGDLVIDFGSYLVTPCIIIFVALLVYKAWRKL
jgi:Family of unknown function (DUF5317)